MPEEMKAKMSGREPWSKSQKGVHLSSTTEFRKGNVPWNKDKEMTDDWKRQHPNARYWKGRVGSRVGAILSEAQKIAHSIKMHGKIPMQKGKTLEEAYGTEKAAIAKMKMREARRYQIVPTRDTSIEVALQQALSELGIPFTTHKPLKLPDGRYHQADIFIEPNIVINADGDYWHNLPANKIRDERIDKELLGQGYKVYRLWEHEINEGKRSKAVKATIQKKEVVMV